MSVPTSALRARFGRTQLRLELHSTSKSSYSFFRNVGANIVSNGFAPMAWLHPGKSGEFRARQDRMHWAARDEILHIRQRDSSNSFSLQGKPQAMANIDRILGPFLPAASPIVGQMQNAVRVFVDGQTQPTRYIDGIGRRRKFVGYGCDHIVLASTLNDLIDKAPFIRSEDPGGTNDQMLRGNVQHPTLPFQLRFAINAQ